jgi:hypothetical protein
MGQVTVKGNSIYFIKRYIVEKHGSDYFTKLIEHVDPEVREILSGSLVSNLGYPLQVKDALLESYLLEEKCEATFRECSAQEVRQQLQGLMRIVVGFVSLDILTKALQLLWNCHFSGGVITGARVKGHSFVLRVSGIEASRAFWLHIEEYIRGLYEAVGKTKFTSSHKQVSTTEVEFVYLRDRPGALVSSELRGRP